MCHAIIELKFHSTTSPIELIKIDDEASLEQRLATFRNNERVERIRVFVLTKTLTQVRTWTES